MAESRAEIDTKKTPRHMAGRLRERSLRAAGIGTLIADVALITHGITTGQGNISTAGIFGLTAGTVGARYGSPKSEKKLEQLSMHLGDYLRRQGVEIPKDPTTEKLNKPAGVIDHVESFLYTYPSQIMNVFYGLIGTQFAKGAKKTNDNKLMASGMLLMGGALAGLLIPEKKPDPEHPPHGALAKAKSWVQEKPLRVSGTLFNLNQVTLAMSALDEKKRNPGNNSYLIKLLAVAGFAFGNVMMMVSSKSNAGSKLDEKAMNALAESSAQVIAAQPKQTQEELLGHVAGFLSTQPHIHMSAAEISEVLHKKLDEVARDMPQQDWQGKVVQKTETAAIIPR